MLVYVLVFIGAGIGGCLRQGVNVASGRYFGTDFPWGTLVINVTGSFVMGLVAGYLAFRAQEAWSPQARFFVMTGILGGYTTFSAFSLDAILLWERNAISAAIAYVVGSVMLAILGLVAGLAIVRSLT